MNWEHSSGNGRLELHVRAAQRPRSESRRLLHDLSEMCWPSGSADRTEPLARGWLALWGPQLLIIDTPVCRCAEGRCQICN